jgi:hypothetical protein
MRINEIINEDINKHLNEFDPGRSGDDDDSDDNGPKLPYYDSTKKTKWVDGISKGKKEKFTNFRSEKLGRGWWIIFGDTLRDGSVEISRIKSEEVAQYLVSRYLILNQQQ